MGGFAKGGFHSGLSYVSSDRHEVSAINLFTAFNNFCSNYMSTVGLFG